MLRQWEELEAGDPPVAGLWHEETARLLAVLLSIVDRELLFHLEEEATSEGYPLVAVYGEQGPQVAGWLDRYEPRWAEGLHLLEAIIRSPSLLADLLEAAGPGAEELVGRIRARRQKASRHLARERTELPVLSLGEQMAASKRSEMVRPAPPSTQKSSSGSRRHGSPQGRRPLK
ncbi:MAG TPA: hypothetical protein VGR07_17145 [Thermoanaerobaculia bacterium]|nr:hypothetical protein [Thermoanaerobaculia bacterium]